MVGIWWIDGQNRIFVRNAKITNKICRRNSEIDIVFQAIVNRTM